MANSKDDPNREVEIWSRNKTPDQILNYAREMRKEPTEAESILWSNLRNRKLKNLKFRRQQPIEGFIIDFYCESARLGVEVDGEIHLNEEQRNFDQQRTEYLAEFGIRIVRFKNDDVINDIKKVLNIISEETKLR
jgi:very-short-patch-repair endonuclease